MTKWGRHTALKKVSCVEKLKKIIFKWEDEQQRLEQQQEVLHNHAELLQRQQRLLQRQLHLLLQLQLFQQAHNNGNRGEDPVVIYYQYADGFIEAVRNVNTTSQYRGLCIAIEQGIGNTGGPIPDISKVKQIRHWALCEAEEIFEITCLHFYIYIYI